MTSDEKTKSGIEKSQVKNRYGKRVRIQSGDDIVLDEAKNEIICLDIDIQQENLQRKHVHKEYFSKKVDERKNNNELLDVIYVVFATIKLKKIWKQHHQYLKFMGFLLNKRKKKDDVFVSYTPP